MTGFKIPLDFSNGSIYENNIYKEDDKHNEEQELKNSIENFIRLLVSSPNGSFKPDSQFGFSLKNFRFENADSEDKINQRKIRGKSDNYAKDLKEAIEHYETRLQNVEVKIEFDRKQSEVRITVSGVLVDTKKEYKQDIKFYIW